MTISKADERPTALLLGTSGSLSDAIARRLRSAEMRVAALDGLSPSRVEEALDAISCLSALVIVTPQPKLGTPLLDVTDDQLSVSLDRFLDLFGALHLALPRLENGGAVVAVSSRGHLGAWGGVHEMAFAGALAGLLRSVALENMGRAVRANLIALELPDAGRSADDEEIADLAEFLLSPAAASVNGELILANGGNSLKMREARDRRAKKVPVEAT